LKPNIKLKKKQKIAQALAIKALKNKPTWKPSNGFKYIEDVPVGELVDTYYGLRAVVIEQSSVSTSVIVLRADHLHQSDRSFYIGKHRWGSKTEVKIIGD
jgi:hypothetical protein